MSARRRAPCTRSCTVSRATGARRAPSGGGAPCPSRDNASELPMPRLPATIHAANFNLSIFDQRSTAIDRRGIFEDAALAGAERAMTGATASLSPVLKLDRLVKRFGGTA